MYSLTDGAFNAGWQNLVPAFRKTATEISRPERRPNNATEDCQGRGLAQEPEGTWEQPGHEGRRWAELDV